MASFEQRWNRTLQAVHMEKVDKIPFSYSGSAYVARREGLTIAEFVSDYPKAIDAAVQFCKDLPGIDTLHTPIMNPDALKTLWLSEVKVPGRDLPEDELWQIHEYKRMELEDYEKILKIGYGPWLAEYMQNRPPRLGGPGAGHQRRRQLRRPHRGLLRRENADGVFSGSCRGAGTGQGRHGQGL